MWMWKRVSESGFGLRSGRTTSVLGTLRYGEVFLYQSDAAAWLDGAAERVREEGKAASCIIECLRSVSMV